MPYIYYNFIGLCKRIRLKLSQKFIQNKSFYLSPSPDLSTCEIKINKYKKLKIFEFNSLDKISKFFYFRCAIKHNKHPIQPHNESNPRMIKANLKVKKLLISPHNTIRRLTLTKVPTEDSTLLDCNHNKCSNEIKNQFRNCKIYCFKF